jgi:O-antigen/teichoic acid export membrane protein
MDFQPRNSVGLAEVRPSFRTQVLRGSAYLSFRLAAGAGIGLVGISLLTRMIGPANYGIFTAASAVLVYLVTLTEWGIGVYLIRLERDVQEEFHQALTLLLLFSICGIVVGFAAIPLIEHISGLKSVGTAMMVLFLGLPIVHVVKVPMARLERALDYRRVARIELIGNVAYYLVALPCAYKGAGVGAPLAGWWAQQFVQLVQVYQTGYRPRLVWYPNVIKRMLSFGTGYCGALLIYSARDLVNPIVVGRFVGAAGVGYVALAVRVVQQLGFVRAATARIAIAAFTRLQADPDRLGRAISEGMFLQIIAIGPLLCAFALLAPFAIPLAFGSKWLAVSQIYPYLALAALITSMFQLHSSALTVFGLNFKQSCAQLIRLLVLAGATALLVPHVGVNGYGLAEVAALPAFCLVLHVWVSSRGVQIHYRHALIWLLAFAFPLFAGDLGNYVWLSVLIPLFWPGTRRELWQLGDLLKRGRVAE